MEYPMKVYGLNLIELFLKDFLAAVGWLLVLFTIMTAIFSGSFLGSGIFGGILIAATALNGIVLLLASSGIRQNRAALELGYALLVLVGVLWLVSGIIFSKIAAIIAAVVIIALFGIALFLRREAARKRFNPRCLSVRQFQTMIQVADTMIEGDGREVQHPIETAIRVDHLLHEVDSPLKKDIQTVLTLTEWLLPVLIWRPFPFSALGSNERRRAVEKVIGAKGLFRDVARTLKMLSCVGYYGSPGGMGQVGYIPFEERERSQGVNQAPSHYPDPFR